MPNIHQFRENLAEYLLAAARGEEVVICRRNQPVARLVAVTRASRPIGRAADAGTPLPASFREPLPQETMGALASKQAAPAVPTKRRKA